MKSEITIKYNTELLQDLETFVNKYQDDIETMTTQYDKDKIGLFVVTLQFYPVIVGNKQKEEEEEELK